MSGSRARRVVVAILMLAAGVALLWWQIAKINGKDPGAIGRGFAAIGIGGFAAILALSLTRFALRSIAWRTLMGGGVSIWDTILATLAGDALGNVTPFGLLASEPAKAIYLRNVESSRALAALTAENVFYSVSIGVVIVLGSIAMVTAFKLSPEMLWTGIGLVAGAFTGVALALWFLWRQPSLAARVLKRIPFVSGRAIADRIHQFEGTTYSFVRQRPDRIAIVIACDAAFHVVSWMEAWLTLYLLTGQSLPVAAFVLDTLNRIVNVVFKMVPLRLGVDQASANFLAVQLGLLEGIGLTMSLVRTVRLLFWAAVGVLLLTGRAARRPSS